MGSSELYAFLLLCVLGQSAGVPLATTFPTRRTFFIISITPCALATHAQFTTQHFWNAHAPCDTIGSFRCDQSFSLWAFPSKNKCTFFAFHDVLENLFLDFVICSRKCTSTIAICVSCSCTVVTQLALYYACDHEHFMSFKICLVL